MNKRGNTAKPRRQLLGGPIPGLAMTQNPVPPPPYRQGNQGGSPKSYLPWFIAALGCGVIALILIAIIGMAAAIMFPALNRASEAARTAACANHLKMLGTVHHMYASENRGTWLALSEVPGVLSFALEPIREDYLTDMDMLLCPSSPTDIQERVMDGGNDLNYVYFGYVLTSEEEFEAFAEAYAERIEAGLPFDENLPAPEGLGSAGGNEFVRLAQDLEGDIGVSPAEIPVMWDREPYHDGAINVLYMDGHVARLNMGEGFPATKGMQDLFEEMEATATKADSGSSVES